MCEETTIIHVRLHDFQAGLEQVLVPVLRRRPVVIGEDVVRSCSREARQLGVRVGMETPRARRRCPAAIVMPGHPRVYACKVEEAWGVCRRFTVSLESYEQEAYGDVSGLRYVFGTPERLGTRLAREIERETGVPVAVGLGSNRLLAWMAAQGLQPGQAAWIRPLAEAHVLLRFPLKRLPGVSWEAIRRLREMNIERLGELQAFSREQLRAVCGGCGDLLYERCRGLDRQTIDSEQRPTRIEHGVVLPEPVCDEGVLRCRLLRALEPAMSRLRDLGLRARRVEVSIGWDDGKVASGRRCLGLPTDADHEVEPVAGALLGRLLARRVAVRRVSVGLDRFGESGAAGDLFAVVPLDRREVYATIDTIRRRYGGASIHSGNGVEAEALEGMTHDP